MKLIAISVVYFVFQVSQCNCNTLQKLCALFSVMEGSAVINQTLKHLFLKGALYFCSLRSEWAKNSASCLLRPYNFSQKSKLTTPLLLEVSLLHSKRSSYQVQTGSNILMYVNLTRRQSGLSRKKNGSKPAFKLVRQNPTKLVSRIRYTPKYWCLQYL